jgi:hypothetical protein
MNRRRIIYTTVVVSVFCAFSASAQTRSAPALPETLRAHLKSERLQVVTSIRGLPLGVRDEMRTLFGSQTLDIAEPGAEFQATGVGRSPTRPLRRMIAAGCSADHCLLYYERGGTAHTWHVVIFKWTPQATRFEWGGTAPNNLATIDTVQRMVLSGAIKGANSIW